MAADVVLGSDSPNPCCAELKKKFLELKEGRNALRKAVKLLQDQTNKLESENKLLKGEIDKLEGENRQLKKEYEEERVREVKETEAKAKESSIRNDLEEKIQNLKSEISSYQKSESLRHADEEENGFLRAHILEKETEIKRLRELLEKEKKRGDSEKRKAEQERTKATEAWKLVKVEKSKAGEERKRTEREIKNAEECRLCLEKAKTEADEVREKLIAEMMSKADDANKRVEAEKQRGNREKKRADLERAKAEEQGRLTELERKRAMDEKTRADHLCQQLEEEKQRRDQLQKKLEETLSFGAGKGSSWFEGRRCNGNANIETHVVKLLKEQLKLEKKKVKHEKRMAKLEKAEKKFLRQELHLLKEDFVKILSRLNMLDCHLSQSIEGTDGLAKIGVSSELCGFYLENDPCGLKRCSFNSRNDSNLPNTSYIDSLNARRACSGLELSGGSCTRLASGTDSELNSPIGGSIRKKIQSSAICSTTSSLSDRKFMGSQGRNAFVISKLAKLAKNSNQKSSVPKTSVEVAKTTQNKDVRIVSKNANKNYIKKDLGNVCFGSSFHNAEEATDPGSDRSRKKRKIQDTLESLEWLYSEYKQLHSKIGEQLSALNDNLNSKDCCAEEPHSQTCGIANYLKDKRGHPTEDYDSTCRRKFNPRRNGKADKQHGYHLQPSHQIDIQKQKDKFVNERNEALLFLTECEKPHQVREDVNIGMEESSRDVSSKQGSLDCFEKDYLKLLDLDNAADEIRYREAVEMPLSPTLPKIVFHSLQLHDGDSTYYLIEDLNRRFETERGGSDTSYAFHVIDIEITSNLSNMNVLDTHQELVSCSSQSSLHSSKEPGSGVTASHIDVNGHDMLHGIQHSSFFMNDGRPEAKKISNVRESDSFINNVDIGPCNNESIGHHGRNRPFVCTLLDANALSNLKACDGEISGDNMLQSKNISPKSARSTVHTKPLAKDEVTKCYNLRTDDMGNSTSPQENNPQENKPSQVLVYTQASNDCLSEDQIDGYGKEIDGSVIAQTRSNKILDSQIRSSMKGSTTKTGTAMKMPSSTFLEIEDPCKSSGAIELEKNSNYCVVFTDTKDEDSISRITCSRNAFLNHKSIVSHSESMVLELLHYLALEQDLQPKEKISVFFSSLLYDICTNMPANSKCYVSGDCQQYSETFAAEISRVISNEETRWFFEEICQLDVLVSLIEDFLIDRKVLMYIDGPDGRLHPYISSCNYHRLGERNLYVSFRAATINQFVSGCIILASICAAINYIGCLLETSYRILRLCCNETLWVLSMLHVFASICGESFFDLDSYSFLVTAIKSVVLLLERGQEPVSSLSPHLSSASNGGSGFLPCEQCPFANDVVCVDKLMFLLLDVLHNYVLNGFKDLKPLKPDALTDTILTCSSRGEKNLVHESELTGQHIDCNSACFLFSCRSVSSDRTDCLVGNALCCFTDIASLVELIGCYMSWEWIHSKVISRLLKMLESCASEEFSAALFVLIGQLARMGIDAGGYQQHGISELAYTLSVFFDTRISGEEKLHTQFAAVSALIQFLPLKFEEIIIECLELSWDTDQSSLVKSLKKWFSQLSREQQSFVFDLFGHANVQKDMFW